MREPYHVDVGTPPGYDEVEQAFEQGHVFTASRDQLIKYLNLLSQNVTGDDAVQSRDMVQAITLNHLILKQHIDHLERKSNVTQWLVIALTIASLLASVAQVGIALSPRSDLFTPLQPVSPAPAHSRSP